MSDRENRPKVTRNMPPVEPPKKVTYREICERTTHFQALTNLQVGVGCQLSKKETA